MIDMKILKTSGITWRVFLQLGYSRKNPNREGLWYTFLKNTEIFRFATLTLEILEETGFHHWKLLKNCVTPLGNYKVKNARPMEIPHEFFLSTPQNSTSLLNDPWNFHMLLLQYPWKFHVLNLYFFWNSPFKHSPENLSFL